MVLLALHSSEVAHHTQQVASARRAELRRVPPPVTGRLPAEAHSQHRTYAAPKGHGHVLADSLPEAAVVDCEACEAAAAYPPEEACRTAQG